MLYVCRCSTGRRARSCWRGPSGRGRGRSPRSSGQARMLRPAGGRLRRWRLRRRVCQARLVSPSPEQVVDYAARTGHDLEVELITQLIGRLPESRPGSELHPRDRHVHRVDETGVEKLPNGGGSAAKPDVLALRSVPRPLEGRPRVGVDEVERGVGGGERRTCVVGQHEHRGVKRGLVVPPAAPVVVVPGAPPGSAWPNGLSMLCWSPAPNPSDETLKFWTLSSWFTGSSCTLDD